MCIVLYHKGDIPMCLRGLQIAFRSEMTSYLSQPQAKDLSFVARKKEFTQCGKVLRYSNLAVISNTNIFVYMEIKHNDATRNRPEGDRVLDAPYVFADLPAFIEQVKDEKAWEKSDRNAITVFKTQGMTIVLSAMKEGAVIKDNTVNGFFTVQVLEGSVRLETLEGDTKMDRSEER